MIFRSRLVMAGVLVVSTAAHLGALTLFVDSTSVAQEGGGPATETPQGTSFADLSTGVEAPVTPSNVTTAAQPAPQTPTATPPASPTPTAAPLAAAAPVAPAPQPSHTPAVNPSAAPSVNAPPEPAAARQPTEPTTVVAALADDAPAPAVSARPRAPQKRPVVAPAPRPAVASKKGNAERSARAGTQDGRAQTPARKPLQSGKAAPRKASGNAEASNYPGLVMARLARVPRPRVSSRGAATIRFTISDSGQIAALSVAQPSGSTALDRAALLVVQRAQPFPQPPSGARRSYTVKIEGK